jgi:ATP adenylyltransferase
MSFEQLWAGWRSAYVSSVAEGAEPGDAQGCLFCALGAGEGPDPSRHVLVSEGLVAVALNAYPYASGHLLVLPRRHVGELEDLGAEEALALWQAVADAVRALKSAYRPDGLNVGINLGRAAGAGIPGHLHVHVVPRWGGDTNFMTTAAAVRVLPESLPETFARLRAAWPGRGG